MSALSTLSEQVVAAIGAVVGTGPVALHEPSFTGNEWLYLKECLDSTFVSSVGRYVDRFEIELAAFTGAKYAVAVVNGTSALHISLKLASVKFDDEVLVPALAFVATANAVTYCGAMPHLVDSDARTLGVDVEKLRDSGVVTLRGSAGVDELRAAVLKAYESPSKLRGSASPSAAETGSAEWIVDAEPVPRRFTREQLSSLSNVERASRS